MNKSLKNIGAEFYSPYSRCWNLRGPEVDINKATLIKKPVRQYSHRGVLYTILACVNIHAPCGIFYNLEVKRPIGVSFPNNPDTDFKMVKGLLAYLPISDDHYRAVEEKVMKELGNRQKDAYLEQTRINALLMQKCRQTKTLIHSVKCFQQIEAAWTDHTQEPIMTTDVSEVAIDVNDGIIRTKGWLRLQRDGIIDNVQDCKQTMETDTSDEHTDGIHGMADVTSDEKQDTHKEMNYDNSGDDDDKDDGYMGGIMGVFCRSGLHGDYTGAATDEERIVG